MELDIPLPSNSRMHNSNLSARFSDVTMIFFSSDEYVAQRIQSLFPEGVSIIVATTPQFAQQVVLQEDADILIIDGQFDNGKGIALCKALKQSARLASVPIIITATKRDKVEEEEALMVGAADYFENDLSTMAFYMRLKNQLEHIQQIRELEEASREDGLTGLVNRRQLEETINKEWHSAIRGQHPVTILLIDVDQFKLYNDCFGYLSGDECLRQVTLTLEKCISRAEDTIARYDGEEFLAILPRSDLNGAQEVASQLVAGIEELGLKHSDLADKDIVTVTIGGVTFSPDKGSAGTSIEQVVVQTKSALAKAKKCGRGKILIE